MREKFYSIVVTLYLKQFVQFQSQTIRKVIRNRNLFTKNDWDGGGT